MQLAVEPLRPQVGAQRILQFDQGDEVRPAGAVDESQHRGVLEIGLSGDLADRSTIERSKQRPGDCLSDGCGAVRLAAGPLPRDQVVPRRAGDSASARHRPSTVDASCQPVADVAPLDLTWSIIQTILVERMFASLGKGCPR